MIVIVAPNPMPRCRRCGETMDFYVLGLPLSEHIHDECLIEEFGEKCREEIGRALDEALMQGREGG